MVKSVISCSSVENTVHFDCGDIVKDEYGNLFLVTDEEYIVIVYSKTEQIGECYSSFSRPLSLVPQGLSVTLTQE